MIGTGGRTDEEGQDRGVRQGGVHNNVGERKENAASEDEG